MQIIEMPTGDLIPYENNPRNNAPAVKAVAESIQAFGFKVPIVIDKDNVIVCGHTRLMAALRLGLDTVPCVRADDLTDEQVKAFRLADNKTSELAEWDFTKLEQELAELDNWDMSAFGFDIDMSIDEPTEVVEDDYNEEPPAEPKAKLGDIYQLGSWVYCKKCGKKHYIS